MLNPDAGPGISLACHPFAGAMLTVGISVDVGGGRVGLAPTVWSSGIFAESPQPASAITAQSKTQVVGPLGIRNPKDAGLFIDHSV
jgi:hypothetical protein